MTETAEARRVDYRVDDGIALVRLDRPDVRNAIDDAMRIALVDVIERVTADDSVRALILTGNGPAFCAGGDVAGMRARLESPHGRVAGNGWRRQRQTHRMVLGLHNLGKVTIAAVNGPAIGVGMDLALSCDFIVASDAAMFSMTHIVRGLVPDGGAMYFLPRRVGLSRAKELIFTGRRISAQEALTLGVADRIVPLAELEMSAVQWARELSAYSPTALALAKSILDRTFELGAEELFALGAEAQAICYTSEEHLTSIEAFLKKTPGRA
ncbi:MAG: enoyl-CoA hydratase/isomerase family protein [Elusimicrobia bacterium]|nr:enoyl-CoA hydratase/isomerase family protein [Elusimicrobiota bacterium]